MAVREESVRIGGKEVKITRPGKVLFPEDGITKADLIRYYRRIAPRMLPHLRNRPAALERYPDGIDQPGFFQPVDNPAGCDGFHVHALGQFDLFQARLPGEAQQHAPLGRGNAQRGDSAIVVAPHDATRFAKFPGKFFHG